MTHTRGPTLRDLARKARKLERRIGFLEDHAKFVEAWIHKRLKEEAEARKAHVPSGERLFEEAMKEEWEARDEED